MISTRTEFLNFAPYRAPRQTGFLARISDAVRNYYAFKRLPAFRLEDMGLTPRDQHLAGFREFLDSPAYDQSGWR